MRELNNLYPFIHPSEAHTARYRRNTATPLRFPSLHFRTRTALGLLVIGLFFGIPAAMATTVSPANLTCESPGNQFFVPTGYGTASPGSGDTGTTFTFTAKTTGCGASGQLLITWDFGDGTTSSAGLSVTHTYKNGGIFTWSFSWHYAAGSMGPPSPPGTDGPYSGSLTVVGHWTNGDWSIEPSQTEECIHDSDPQFTNGNYCMAWRAEVKADGQETNGQVDYYQVTFEIYAYNITISPFDYDAQISFASPNPGGWDTMQPSTPQTLVWGQSMVTLSYSFLSVTYQIPYEQIDCRNCALNNLDWHVYSSFDLVHVCGNNCEQGTDISLPEGQAWSISFNYWENLSLNSNRYGITNNCSQYLTACNFSFSGTINIPGGHQDPPSGQLPPCCDSGTGGGGGGGGSGARMM